jgi:mRNA-degrading endonuclease RelE of RelBE toxin-antitoxin system
MTVVETPFFFQKVDGLRDEEERLRLTTFVGANPDVGDVIPETGGVRKLRWSVDGRGKRGGLRVIYYFHSETFPLFLLTVYGKNRKANLTMTERHEFKKLLPLLVKSYAKGRKL